MRIGVVVEVRINASAHLEEIKENEENTGAEGRAQRRAHQLRVSKQQARQTTLKEDTKGKKYRSIAMQHALARSGSVIRYPFRMLSIWTYRIKFQIKF